MKIIKSNCVTIIDDEYVHVIKCVGSSSGINMYLYSQIFPTEGGINHNTNIMSEEKFRKYIDTHFTVEHQNEILNKLEING